MMNHFRVVRQNFSIPVMAESAEPPATGNASQNIARSLQSTSEQLEQLTRIVSSQATAASTASELQAALVASNQALQASTNQIALQQTALAESQATIADSLSAVSAQLGTAVSQFATANSSLLTSLVSLNDAVAENAKHLDALIDTTASSLSKSIRLDKWDGSSRNRANWFSVAKSRSRFRQHDPRCELLVSDSSLTFECDPVTH